VLISIPNSVHAETNAICGRSSEFLDTVLNMPF